MDKRPPIGNRQSAKLPADESAIGASAFPQSPIGNGEWAIGHPPAGPGPQSAIGNHQSAIGNVVLAQAGPPSGPPTLTQPRLGATLQVLSGEGKLLIAGGRASLTSPPLSSAELYDPATGTMQPIPSPMVHGRVHLASSVAPTGEILIGAGENLNGRTSEFEIHVPSLGQFVASALRLDAPRSGHTQTVASDGRTILIAGTNGSAAPSGAISIVNARAGTITPSRAQLGTPRTNHSAVLDPITGHIVVLGGRDGTGQPLASGERYDPATDQMVNAAINLLTPRSDAVALVRPDGKAWLLGGYGPNNVVLDSTELIDLTTGQVTAGPALRTPRAGAVGALLGDGRTFVSGGTADQRNALASIDLLPSEPDQVPPRLVAASPAHNATGVPTDSFISLRFSEPLRPATATAASVVLTGPQGRVEGTLALAEAGLLLFFAPASPLTPDAPHSLALLGLTDLAGNPLGPVTFTFQTAPGGGEGPRITAFSPSAGPEGEEVILRGERFTGATRVAFGGTATSQFQVVSAGQIKAVVPTGALSGPLSVATPAGTGTSQGVFAVLSTPSFALRVSPDRGAETIAGDVYTFALNVVPSGGFLGNVRLGVSGLPAHLKATFDKPVLAPVGYAYLTLEAADRLRAGQYHITITGTATLGSQDVTRTVAATLRVAPPAGTSLSGRLVRLDDVPVPNYTVRVGHQRTVSDAAGNFLLRHLHLPKPQKKDDLVLVLDGRTARLPGVDYPIYEQLLEYDELQRDRPNRVNYGHPIWIFTLGPRNAIQVQPEAPQDRTYKFAHIPGLEITVPAGTTFKDIDGQPTTTINAARIPLSRPHLHDLPQGVTPGAIFSLQLGGTTPSKPISVTMPNTTNLPPGARVGFWFYDIHRDGWYSPGKGTVSDDGQKIVPDPGVGVTRLHCVLPEPTPDDEDEECDECADFTEAGEDKVDVTSGVLLHRMTDLVVPGRLPLVFTRIYKSKSRRVGAFGKGHAHTYDFSLAATGGSLDDPTGLQLILPTNKKIRFVKEGTRFFARASPTYWGVEYTHPVYLFPVLTARDGTRWTFNSGRVLARIEDRHGNQLTFDVPGAQPPLRISTPDGTPYGRELLRLEYDGQNRITRIIGPLDQTVNYTYNSDGDLETVTDPRGGVTRYTYQVTPDGFHLLKTITPPRGITKWTMDYDPVTKRVTKQTRADGGFWRFDYTTEGSRVTRTVVTDPRGKTRTYDLENGYIMAVTNHLGQTTTFTRDPLSRHITRVQDHLQRRTDLRYDAQKNVDQIKKYKDPPPANPPYQQPVVREFTYDPTFNLLTQYKDPLDPAEPGQHVWTYGLDAAKKNVVSITNPLGKTWTINPNSSGQPQWIEQPVVPPDPPSRTTFGYDPATGLLASVQDHLGNTTTYTYDQLGRRVTTTDPRGFTTRSTYDRLNRVIAVADPLGGAVRFQYDPNSNLTRVTDPRNGQINYTYTNMDLLDTRTDPLGRTETYTYDAQGGSTFVSFRDRKNQLTTWAPYDDLNRPTTMTFQDGSTLAYRYDAANRLDQLTENPGERTITRTFDKLDRLTREVTPQGTIDYEPDDADRRTSMTVAGQPDVTYLWDNANRLQSITRATLVATYGYDDANRRTSLTLPNNVVIGYGYDLANRLTALTYTAPSGPLGDLSYAYDGASNRVVTAGAWARTLLPDAVSGGTYDAANRQLTLGPKTMAYDFNGNLATLTDGGQTTYTWDVRNRLTNVAGPGLTASFAYDAEGRRTQKTINAFVTNFQYDGRDIIKESAGGQTVNYLRGLGIDEHLARIEDGGSTTCYLGDALGSTVALSDGTGAVPTEYTYEPFGETAVTGTPSGNPFQYTGRENDGTGRYFYRARYYSPRLARFTQEDPIELAGGDANLYAYVHNNPVNLVDPNGLAAFAICIVFPHLCAGAAITAAEVCLLLLTAIIPLAFTGDTHGRYWCKVRCNVHVGDRGYQIEGEGRANSPGQACDNAEIDAKSKLAGRTGHISKHCHPIAQGQR